MDEDFAEAAAAIVAEFGENALEIVAECERGAGGEIQAGIQPIILGFKDGPK